MKLYLAGLASDVTNVQLMQAFNVYGQVDSAELVTDRFSGTPRGLGFVEMTSRNEAIAAISGLNGKELTGQALEVNEARPPAPLPHGRDQRGGDRRGGRGRQGGNRRGGRDRRPGGKRS